MAPPLAPRSHAPDGIGSEMRHPCPTTEAARRGACLLLAALYLVTGPRTEADESPLGAPISIADVVPHAALDSLQLSPPARSASAPTLTWQPARAAAEPAPSPTREASRPTTPAPYRTRSILGKTVGATPPAPTRPARVATRPVQAEGGPIGAPKGATGPSLVGPSLNGPMADVPTKSATPAPADRARREPAAQSPGGGLKPDPAITPLPDEHDGSIDPLEAPPASAFDPRLEVRLGPADTNAQTEQEPSREDDRDSSYHEATEPAPLAPSRAARPLVAVPGAKPLERVPSAATQAPAASIPARLAPPARSAPMGKPDVTTRAPRSRSAEPGGAIAQPVLPFAADPAAPLSRSMTYLRSRLRTVLSYYYRKPMNTVENDAWEVMHGMLAYELYSRILDGGPAGKPITAVGHLCYNRPSARKQLLYVTKDGDLDVRVGVGVQGHSGQFLAMLAQCNVSPDYPIRVEGREFTIRDLIRSEQRTCYAKTELTFKLIGLGHYLESGASWVNEQGEQWDIPRLIREERTQPIRGAACGGTHRLSGLSLAYRRREARGEPIDGEYLEAAKFVSQYQTQCFRQQNSDGSLSTSWFNGPGDEDDIERRIRTTGHQLEWLVYSLPDKQLRSPQTLKTLNYLVNLLATNANQEWHLGSLGHATHALVVYDKRVFQPHDNASAAGAGLASTGAIDPTASLYRNYGLARGVMRNSDPQGAGILGLFGTPRTSGRSSSGSRSR
ncbi:MAG: hypothetical protein ACRCT8_07005 [Lacipirellulaceae bacterium]